MPQAVEMIFSTTLEYYLSAFEEPVQAVAPGQAAVFYDAENDEELIGGGWLAWGAR